VTLQETHIALAFNRLQIDSIRAKNRKHSNMTYLASQYLAMPHDHCFVYGGAGESLKDRRLTGICAAQDKDPEFQISSVPEREVVVLVARGCVSIGSHRGQNN
jgi:hypothetical protein